MAAAMNTIGLIPSTDHTALATMVDERLSLHQQLATLRTEPSELNTVLARTVKLISCSHGRMYHFEAPMHIQFCHHMGSASDAERPYQLTVCVSETAKAGLSHSTLIKAKLSSPSFPIL